MAAKLDREQRERQAKLQRFHEEFKKMASFPTFCTLVDFLGGVDCLKSMKLIYRGSTHGFGADKFHARCDFNGPTLTIVLSDDNWRFGGFTMQSWKSTREYIDDPKAFLFNLDLATKYPYLGDGRAIYCVDKFGPCFGGGSDLFIDDECNRKIKNR